MEGSLSLVIFTLLGQASAGMVLLLPFFADPETGRGRIAGGVALALLCAGALFSLGHLSDPWVSFYTITNAGTSWLSREIWFVGLLGAATLAWLVTRRAWIRWLAALVGLGLVYVMSRVYTLPTVPFWNSAATFWTFLASGLLTGAATLLFLNGLAARRDPEAARRLATGWQPVILVLTFGLRVLVLPLQWMASPMPDHVVLQCWTLAFLLAGAALGPLLLVRNGCRAALSGESRICPCPLAVRAGILCGLTWAGEICGRMLFYSGYTWFGM